MSLKIRLSRGGAKKRPFYRIVLADSHSPRDGRFIERLGTYNPLLQRDNPERVRLNAERIEHWLKMGALPTDRVAQFLGQAGVIAAPAQRTTPKKSTPKAKAQERLKAAGDAKKAAEEAAAAAATAAAAAAAAPPPAEEAPAEEAPAGEAPAEGEPEA